METDFKKKERELREEAVRLGENALKGSRGFKLVTELILTAMADSKLKEADKIYTIKADKIKLE